jgi:DNA-binding MarR family transcriptional regulator
LRLIQGDWIRYPVLGNGKYEVTMKDFPDMDEDFKLWGLLGQTADVMLRARQKELYRYGISAIEAGTLWVIQVIGEKATPAQITRWLLREPHTVTELLNRMVKKGLVTKTKDLERRNLIRVSITEKGRQAYEHSTKRKSIHKMISSLSEEERQQLMASLKKLRNRALKELRVEHKPLFP